MTLEYTPISSLDEQLVQREGDHLVSVDMNELLLEDRTKRIYPENLAVQNIKKVITQAGHGFAPLHPVYYDIDVLAWQLAQANNSDTLATHVVVWVSGDEFILAEQGAFTVTAHGLSLGYWFLSDSVAGELQDAPAGINQPVLQATDADTIRVVRERVLSPDESPTFADLKIPALSQDASYDAATLAYLNSLFATLSDSVKENFLRVWGRLAVADDNLIYEDILTEKAFRIEITVDKNGNPLSETNILVLVDTNYVDDDDLPLSARNIVEINGITSGYTLSDLTVGAFQPSYNNSERMYYLLNFVVLPGLVYMAPRARRGVTLDSYKSLEVLENETITDINSIVIRTSGARYNAVGTKIKIYRQ